MFALHHRTYRHAAPNMTRTFRKLGSYMAEHRIHTYVRGRPSEYEVPDATQIGYMKMMMLGVTRQDVDEEDEDGQDEVVNGEDGDLDV